jgi:hypothetical protein
LVTARSCYAATGSLSHLHRLPDAPATTPAYRVVEIGDKRQPIGTARAINAHGVVAGQLGEGAFTWDGHTFVQYKPEAISYLDGPYTSIATAVNAEGVAVGHDGSYMPESMSGLELATAAIFEHGATTFIERERNGTFEADGINDCGEIVGERGYRVFMCRSDGTIIEIYPLSNARREQRYV